MYCDWTKQNISVYTHLHNSPRTRSGYHAQGMSNAIGSLCFRTLKLHLHLQSLVCVNHFSSSLHHLLAVFLFLFLFQTRMKGARGRGGSKGGRVTSDLQAETTTHESDSSTSESWKDQIILVKILFLQILF